MIIKFSGHVRLVNVIIKDDAPADVYTIAFESPPEQTPDLLINEDGSTPVIPKEK